MPNSSLPDGNPSELGFDEGRLAQIGPEMQKYVDDRRVPLLVTLLARHGKIVHFESRGVLDFDTQVSAPKETLCRMFSNTQTNRRGRRHSSFMNRECLRQMIP